MASSIQNSNNFALGGGGAGDSTYRGNDSMNEDDKGLISESEDGWYAERDKGDDKEKDNDEFSDISEHSSDEVTDSDPENQEGPGGTIIKKTKKVKGEKKKRKKKKQ